MKKVVVGISGGVDSSVAAYLLQKEGYEVIGLFMRNWDSALNNDIQGNPHFEETICPQEQDYNDAKKVCDKLNIPLHRVSFVKEYWDYVFSYFLAELKKGRTPNPDIMCNKYIKFDLFIKEAKKLGADYIATGHYAKTSNGHLYRGIDQNKDQSYFLANITSEALEKTLFPVGDLTKEEVRRIAGELELVTFDKKDSTGICFIGERNYQNFIHNYLQSNPGDIINIETNEVIGQHDGLMNYTIGQRRKVGLSGNNDKHYVVGKDTVKNILYIAFGDDNEYLYSDECLIEDINLINPNKYEKCSAKFRYRGADYPVEIKYLPNNQARVVYKQKVKSVTPGQACVLYLDEECLGCGIIKEVYLNSKKLDYIN